MVEQVRETLGANIARIRGMRGMTVRDLSARLQTLGLRLSPSGVSEVETVRRKVSVDELLVIAIALNTSIIDLLTPADAVPLGVAEGVEPLQPAWLEPWLRGEIPLPREPWGDGSWGSLMAFDPAQLDEFHAAASEHRRMMHRRDARPEIVALDGLRERVRLAIEATEDPRAGEIIKDDMPPERMVEELRADLGAVTDSVNLLAKHIERHGYAKR
ncbi:helix-turn-helix domain-containing protein [Mycobacterium colombiense]